MDKKELQDLPSPGSTKSIPADSRAKPCLRPEEGNKKQLRKAMDKKVLQDLPAPGSTKSIPADSRAKPYSRPEEGNKKPLR